MFLGNIIADELKAMKKNGSKNEEYDVNGKRIFGKSRKQLEEILKDFPGYFIGKSFSISSNCFQ